MAIIAQTAELGGPGGAQGGSVDIDLESGHQVINGLVEVLQRNFKRDTLYPRPLMSPQANILFVLDGDAADSMMVYMGSKLLELGFCEGEFRFIRKTGTNGEMLQRLRLEFPNGVNAHIIRKLLIATDRLERILPAFEP